jgi:hypothetical protein
MMSNLEPEQILEFDFTPGIEIGFLPQEPSWGTTSLMLMGFLPKQGTSFLPYDPEDLGVKGSTPPEVISPPPGGSSPAPPTPPSSPPGSVRPHAPYVKLVKRISPKAYLKHGIRVELYLDAAADVEAHVEAKFKLMHQRKPKERDISKSAARKLAAGFYEITLKPNGTAKAVLSKHNAVSADAVVRIVYEDKTEKTLKQAFRIARPPAKGGKAVKGKGRHSTMK